MRKRSKSLSEARTKIAKNRRGIKNCETSKVEGLRFWLKNGWDQLVNAAGRYRHLQSVPSAETVAKTQSLFTLNQSPRVSTRRGQSL